MLNLYLTKRDRGLPTRALRIPIFCAGDTVSSSCSWPRLTFASEIKAAISGIGPDRTVTSISSSAP